jgi:hypothetical protein
MKRMLAALLCAGLAFSAAGCGETDTEANSSAKPSPSATKKQDPTLPDGLSGSCTGSKFLINNKLGSVNLKTEDGQLDISIPSATDMMLVDIGYYVNIYSTSDRWTQVRIEYSQEDGSKTVSVLDMQTDKTTRVGTFDVDADNDNQLDVSVPTSLIHADEGSQWSAALDENGKDLAFCPAQKDDRSTLE